MLENLTPAPAVESNFLYDSGWTYSQHVANTAAQHIFVDLSEYTEPVYVLVDLLTYDANLDASQIGLYTYYSVGGDDKFISSKGWAVGLSGDNVLTSTDTLNNLYNPYRNISGNGIRSTFLPDGSGASCCIDPSMVSSLRVRLRTESSATTDAHFSFRLRVITVEKAKEVFA